MQLHVFLVGRVVKNPPASEADPGDAGSIPRSGRASGEGNGNPLQCSFWGILWAVVPGGLQSTGPQKSLIQLDDWTTGHLCKIYLWGLSQRTVEPIEKAMHVIYVAVCHHVYWKHNYDICLLEFPISKYEAIKCALRLYCVFSSFCLKKIPSNEFWKFQRCVHWTQCVLTGDGK